MTNTTEFIAPPGRPDMSIVRRFDAAPARVFAAHVDPDEIPLWWGPRRLTTVVHALEARPGGRWHFVQSGADGATHSFFGFFHAVVPGERLVQTFEYEGAPGHVLVSQLRFEPDGDGDGTILHNTTVFFSVEERDAMVDAGMSEGGIEGNERLDELFAARP